MTWACGSSGGANSTNLSKVNNSDSIAVNKSNNSSESETTKKPVAENPRDPKVICAIPGKIGLDPVEYKHEPDNFESTDDYKCRSNSGFSNPKFPGYEISLGAEGDADNIKQVVISSENYKQAAEADERVVELGNEVWQKVFGKPLPDEVKAAILTNKGKSANYEKPFTNLPYVDRVRVKREARNKGQYNLALYITGLKQAKPQMFR
jgi:hypothetical protein